MAGKGFHLDYHNDMVPFKGYRLPLLPCMATVPRRRLRGIVLCARARKGRRVGCKLMMMMMMMTYYDDYNDDADDGDGNNMSIVIQKKSY